MSDTVIALLWGILWLSFGMAYALGAMSKKEPVGFGMIRILFWPLVLVYDIAVHLNKDPL